MIVFGFIIFSNDIIANFFILEVRDYFWKLMMVIMSLDRISLCGFVGGPL
jgi:hypothetical protein